MNSGLVHSLARSTCRLWVRAYTRRLPSEAAERRRQEIESDLYEHFDEAAQAGVTGRRLGAEILGRVLVGVPADLSWRRATRQPQLRLVFGGTAMSLSPSTANRALNALGGLVILWVLVWTPIVMFEDVSQLEMAIFTVVPIASGVAMAVGLLIRSRAPRRALHLIIAGAIGPVVWLWFIPVYVPVMIAVIALAVSVSPRKPQAAAAI